LQQDTQKTENPKPDVGLPARRAAYAVLNEILFRKRSLDEAFARQAELEGLPGRDKAFARLLVSVVLKRAREMDDALGQLLHEPLHDLKPPQLINIFRLGVAQVAFLETPAHAVVNTTVELAEAEGIAHHKPLVNAVMRRLTREGMQKLEARDAGRINTPEWLWNEWMQGYGVETALAIAAANLDEAAIDFSVKSHPDQWAATLDAVALPTGSLRRKTAGFVPDLPGFAQGSWWIQNAAAAIPAQLFGDLNGKTAADLCAAPGGKTAQLAAMGAKVTAVDISAQRITRLKENMQRLQLDVETVISDGASWQPREPVDAVLVDAPCTTTGTIRHQPDVLWLKEPRDQEKLVALQRRLMLNAVKMLKPGGTLVFCTCSLQKAEGEEQADWLVQQDASVRIAPVSAAEVPGTGEFITGRGELRCLPFHWKDAGGIDGFYMARFVKA
jgi:16S rRNA (cytosine967-C5)-methyltransferase